MDALIYIYDNHDRLAFRYGCRWGRCGTCAVTVNGRPVLACKTPIEKNVTVSPLHNFPIIRDLVIDRRAYDQRLARLRLFLERAQPLEGTLENLKAEAFVDFKKANRCIDCLSCSAYCPVVSQTPSLFMGPMALLTLSKFMLDPRDESDRVKNAIFEGLFRCTQCGKCYEVCPLGINIPEVAIRRLRSLALERNLVPSITRGGSKKVLRKAEQYENRGLPVSSI